MSYKNSNLRYDIDRFFIVTVSIPIIATKMVMVIVINPDRNVNGNGNNDGVVNDKIYFLRNMWINYTLSSLP